MIKGEVKRKTGQRAEILFDSIDYKILAFLKKSPKCFGKHGEYLGVGVLELVNELKVNHNSLKPHIDKLMHMNLISSWISPEGKSFIISNYANADFWIDLGDSSKEECEELRKYKTEYEVLMNLMNKAIEHNAREVAFPNDMRKKRAELVKSEKEYLTQIIKMIERDYKKGNKMTREEYTTTINQYKKRLKEIK